MNKKFLYTSMVMAVIANVAIIGCNRQGENTAKTGDTTNVPPAQAETINQSQIAVSPSAEEKQHISGQPSAVPQKNPYEHAAIDIKTFQVNPPATGYGYDIMIDGKAYIHQYNIPGVPGNNGFSSEKNARKAAEFVAYKIRHNIMPPAVDAKELDSLGVLK